ncbi:16S rRNA (uracil(1498)-N(3))-methyltransferase [Mycolicibacterium grossiae]|uniref:Ribosomal RNA small subunit methyltransferase E n=1 Tax=Mycolicibacterium grossiae TaxID=1552759 RepID=A0A1E8Q081_9MYCO|nr:16S rRNA (uracil(1498)-N(3))-methyltransferase [Mycolicibacterium grossiae]OFJ51274.1 16S rRNA (uracil(1498)-N(3))-methyltransferase [Mycolicibacterium grossiae]QEM47267.1 16S rRNA (uracil(1498)-N(3))-methyltransferase [Mycolicibacterium grossiae]
MSRALFYVDAPPQTGAAVVIDGDEGFHAATVRRIRVGEEIDVSDGAGRVAHCTVDDVAKGRLSARVLAVRDVAPPTPTVTVVQALPKSDRAELAVELATEAGADGFLAWQSDRCVARWDGAAKVDKGLRRWQAVARSAARQSRRPWVPEVGTLLTSRQVTDRVAAEAAAGALVLALHESATEPLTGPALRARLTAAPAVFLLVGPEGGISDDEIAALTGAGAVAVRLGPSVLRTSSAAAVALGALGALTSRW